MWRFLRYAIQVALLIVVAVWLVGNPGLVTVEWLGWRIDSSVAVAILLLGLPVIALVIGDRLLRGTLSLPLWWRRRRALRRMRQADDLLTQGFAAVVVGDGAKAGRLADRAQGLAISETLPLLLRAQAAEASGDRSQAQVLWQRMQDEADGDPDRLLLGLHGLAEAALRQGDLKQALDHVVRAQTVAATSPWALRLRHDLEVRTGAWTDADVSLKAMARARLIDGAALRRRSTLVALGRSLAAAADHLPDDAMAHARRAWKADPSFLPAAIISARMDLAVGKASRAAQTVEAAWASCAHPDLAICYAQAAGQRTDLLTQVKRFQLLLEIAPNEAESHLALADAALAARLWGQARQHYEQADRLDRAAHRRASRGLAAVAAAEPPLETARLVSPTLPFALAADHGVTETAESTALTIVTNSPGQTIAAPNWARLAQQLSDPTYAPDRSWHCDACGTPSAEWAPVCSACGSVDQIDWRMPKSMVEPPKQKAIPVSAELLTR